MLGQVVCIVNAIALLFPYARPITPFRKRLPTPLWIIMHCVRGRLRTTVENVGMLCPFFREDKGSLSQLLDAVRSNYNDKYEELRRRWGGGIMGPKALAAKAKLDKAKAKELASKMSA